MPSSKFEATDTWILVALLQATRPSEVATVAQLIASADAVNHAVITRDELENGLSRLVPAGLVEMQANTFAPAARVREFWETTQGVSSLYSSWAKLGTFIGAPSLQTSPAPITATEEYVSVAGYREAISSYAIAIPHPLWRKQ